MKRIGIYEDKDGNKYYAYTDNKYKLYYLIDYLIAEGSYKERGIFKLTGYTQSDVLGFDYYAEHDMCQPYLESFKILHGHHLYTDALKISEGDGVLEIAAAKVVYPELADIIDGLLESKPDALERFINYLDLEEVKPIDQRIAEVTSAANKTDIDDQLDLKIELLQQLKQLREDKNNRHYFNPNFLKTIYYHVGNIVSLRQIDLSVPETEDGYQEIGDMVSLNDLCDSVKEKRTLLS